MWNSFSVHCVTCNQRFLLCEGQDVQCAPPRLSVEEAHILSEKAERHQAETGHAVLAKGVVIIAMWHMPLVGAYLAADNS